jgi:SAM-dependent methyltransferase
VIFGAPKRRRGVEYLDQTDISPDVREQALRDVVRSNTLFGGRRAVLLALVPWLVERAHAHPRPPSATLLDVGTGLADVPEHVHERARRSGVAVRTIGLDGASSVLVTARRSGRIGDAVCGDALALPFADRSVDVVTCSQLLHHFAHDDAVRLLKELHRVARQRVIVSDLRRSWIAVAGYWLSSIVLRFHPVTRHDGVVSILRGFTARELRSMVLSATGGSMQPAVHHRLGFRVTASWAPRP